MTDEELDRRLKRMELSLLEAMLDLANPGAGDPRKVMERIRILRAAFFDPQAQANDPHMGLRQEALKVTDDD